MKRTCIGIVSHVFGILSVSWSVSSAAGDVEILFAAAMLLPNAFKNQVNNKATTSA